jgi:hypothetical protein
MEYLLIESDPKYRKKRTNKKLIKLNIKPKKPSFNQTLKNIDDFIKKLP